MNVFLTSSDAGFYLISQNSTSVSQEVTPPPKKNMLRKQISSQLVLQLWPLSNACTWKCRSYLRPICTTYCSLPLFSSLCITHLKRTFFPWESFFCSLQYQGGGTGQSAGQLLALPVPWPHGMSGMYYPCLHSHNLPGFRLRQDMSENDDSGDRDHW